jgi:hypothetical protein
MKLFKKLFGKNTGIRVTFINSLTSELIGTSIMKAEDLPETFAISTTLSLYDETWSVDEATPPNATDFIKSGSLLIRMSKIELMNTDDLLFTLPSISNELPQTSDSHPNSSFEEIISEDDWRQNEFLPVTEIDKIETEIVMIKNIWQNYSTKIDANFNGFSKCHPRETVDNIKLSIPLTSLKELLSAEKTGNLKFKSGSFINNGFSFKTKASAYYGICDNGIVNQLAISSFSEDTLNEIHKINSEFELLFINWYHHNIID